MIDSEFYTIDNPENNFLKHENVESELLWGEIPPQPIFLTVLIITHKRYELLKRAIESACNQNAVSYDWEIIVMDNNPEEKEVLPYIRRLGNSRIRYYRNKENLGHEGNVNRGVQLAVGKWVAMLHDDDLLVSDYLVLIEKYIKSCERWKYPLAYIRTKHILFKEENELPDLKNRKIEPQFFIKRELWLETLLRGVGPTYVNSCGSVVNRKAFMEIGGYNEKLNPIGDSTLGLIFMSKGYSIYATEKVLGFYRQGENMSSQKHTILSFIEADYLLREYLYSKNIFTRIFGWMFRDIQYSESVDRKIYLAENYQGMEKEVIVKAEEINQIHLYRKTRFKKHLLKIIRRCMVLFYRQSHLIWRER